MEEAPPFRNDGCPELVSRRRLLQLAGGAGVAAVVGGCSTSITKHAPLASPSSAASPATTGTDAIPAAHPPPQPIAPPPPAAASAALLCRDAWGARPARPGGRPHTITRMTLHHEAVVLGDNRNAPAHLRQDQHYHQDQLGWVDIAYHVGVDRDGNIYQLRTPEIAGDTATDYDTTGHFLVLCEGDFDKEVVSEAQLHGAALAFAWATQVFRIAADTLAGHRDLAQTSCPGANLYAHISSGDLKRRIEELLAAGTVNLQSVCGPDAAATVAAIEAGH